MYGDRSCGGCPNHTDGWGDMRCRDRLPHLGNIQRLASGCVLFQIFLPRSKRSRSRRRRDTRHHLTLHHRRWWPCRGSSSSHRQHGLPRRRHGGRYHPSRLYSADVGCRYRPRRLSNGLAAGERRLRHRHHGVWRSAVHECLVVNRVVDVDGVVYVCDVHVRNTGVIHVHVTEITLAACVGRRIHFAIAQGQPAERRASANPDRNAPMRSTEPSHHRGRIIGPTLPARPGSPAPAIIDIRPAAVMERGKTPAHVVLPGPSPGVNPDPAPVMIRCPSRLNPARIPNCSVIPGLLPVAIIVEIFIADHIR